MRIGILIKNEYCIIQISNTTIRIYGNNKLLHSTIKSIGSTIENTIIINFNNLIDFGIYIQYAKVVGNQFFPN